MEEKACGCATRALGGVLALDTAAILRSLVVNSATQPFRLSRMLSRGHPGPNTSIFGETGGTRFEDGAVSAFSS